MPYQDNTQFNPLSLFPTLLSLAEKQKQQQDELNSWRDAVSNFSELTPDQKTTLMGMHPDHGATVMNHFLTENVKTKARDRAMGVFKDLNNLKGAQDKLENTTIPQPVKEAPFVEDAYTASPNDAINAPVSQKLPEDEFSSMRSPEPAQDTQDVRQFMQNQQREQNDRELSNAERMRKLIATKEQLIADLKSRREQTLWENAPILEGVLTKEDVGKLLGVDAGSVSKDLTNEIKNVILRKYGQITPKTLQAFAVLPEEERAALIQGSVSSLAQAKRAEKPFFGAAQKYLPGLAVLKDQLKRDPTPQEVADEIAKYDNQHEKQNDYNVFYRAKIAEAKSKGITDPSKIDDYVSNLWQKQKEKIANIRTDTYIPAGNLMPGFVISRKSGELVWKGDGPRPELTPEQVAEYKASASSLSKQTVNRDMMSSFVSNIGKQVDRLTEISQDISRRDTRLLNVPLVKFRKMIAGSPDESILSMYVTEISNEVARLSTSNAQSIRELSEGAQEKWAKIHDEKLSISDMLKLLKESRHAGIMRLETVNETLEKTKQSMPGSKPNVSPTTQQLSPQEQRDLDELKRKFNGG